MIPDELRAAKQHCVHLYLSAKREVMEFSAFAASTVPRQNVVGVGIGPKIVKGRSKSQHVIRLYVERKVSKEVIPTDYLLPSEIGGIETDVIEAGRFLPFAKSPATKRQSGKKSPGAGKSVSAKRSGATSLAATVPIFQQRLRPARPGGSVGFQFTGAKAGFVMAGTFGAVVRDAAGDLFILSNNHVLANENDLAPGSPIFQPGLLDNGDPAKDRIAALTRFIKLDTNSPNEVDAAIARLDDAALADPKFLPKVNRLKSIIPLPATEKMSVHKVGRTTGYTRGEIFDISADVTVRYDLGVLSFSDQMLIRGENGQAFSDSGDSGSLIVAHPQGRPTGLLFAGSSQFTIANHIERVLTLLNVTLVK